MKRALILLVLLGLSSSYADGLLPKTEPQAIEVKMPDGSKKVGFIKDGIFIPINETSTPPHTDLLQGQAMEPAIQTTQVLPAGTPVQVVLDQDIDADKIKVGQAVDAHIMMPVKHQGQIVFPVGTPVKGMVTQRKNNSIAGVPGSIELGNFKITTPKGAIMPLSGTFQKTGDSRIAGAVGGAYFLLLPIFIKGQDARLQRGTESTMFTLQEWEYMPQPGQ